MTVICPKCANDANVSVDLNDGTTLCCPECDETYTPDDVRAWLEAVTSNWTVLLDWLDKHPARVAEAAAA